VLALRANAAPLWLDLGSAKPPPVVASHDLVVQNLRLIAGGRQDVWATSEKKWSEAALAVDGTMRDFNQLLLRLPLDVQQAMHLEGGPEASLSIHAPGIDLDLSGSYETGFLEDDSNREQWPLPNVIRVAREETALQSPPP
jgi:hypothetical protein